MWSKDHRGLARAAFALSRLALFAVAAVLAWIFLLAIDPPPDPYLDKPASTQVRARDGELLRAFLSADEKWRLRIGDEPLNSHLLDAILQHEDRWFYQHPGVNPFAVLRAIRSNIAQRRIVSGASTITMQLARLTKPERRSVGYKLWQVYRALQYESLYTKEEILEAYLNLAPYGGNIEGVEAAARIYFGKPATALSVAEAAMLAVLPQSPTRRDPIRNPVAARTARDRLLQRLKERGVISPGTAAQGQAERLPTRKSAMPFTAPHFTEWVMATEEINEDAILNTTIDLTIQRRVSTLLRSYVRELHPSGIGQGAAVILDYEAAEIVAVAGSADYFDAEHEGQVNGVLARRSPGSTLKPFIYGLAFDQGLATPELLVEDVPLHLGLYEPKNFDERYLGALSAREALRSSRNVPAVWLARKLRRAGGRGLYEFLKEADVRSIDRPRDHYGLSLVLGGGDLTLMELAELYATLARQGRQVRARIRTDREQKAPAVQLLSEGSAFMVLDILTDVTRPELDAVWRSGRTHVSVPWKTGTSFGHRDAWSIGIAGNYVVAVWIGNFDGKGIPQLTGIEVAAPLLFKLIDLLPHDHAGSWHHYPPSLKSRKVCTASGLPPGPDCPFTKWEPFIPGISDASICQVHRRIQVDVESGTTVCSRCRGEGEIESRVVEWWPNHVARYISTHHLSANPIPPHNPKCTALEPGAEPQITQPQEDVVYFIRPGTPIEDQKIALAASLTRGSHEMFWFLDGELIWKGPPGETVFLTPTAGTHRLVVKDDGGRSAATTFKVRGS